MTLRRRFFPSTPVQQVPGQTVSLEVQLRPEVPPAPAPAAAAPPPSGDCVCDVLGVLMAPEIIPQPWSMIDDGWGSAEAYAFVTRPKMDASRVTGGYLEIPQGETETEERRTVRFLVLGATLCSVEWTWALTRPPLPPPPEGEGWGEPFWRGVSVAAEGGTLLVSLLSGAIYADDPWYAELRATALCGGQPVGEIVLRPGFNLADPEVLPPIT